MHNPARTMACVIISILVGPGIITEMESVCPIGSIAIDTRATVTCDCLGCGASIDTTGGLISMDGDMAVLYPNGINCVLHIKSRSD